MEASRRVAVADSSAPVVFVALKVRAEIKNEAIGARKPWRTRSWPEIIAGFRKEFGII